MKKGKLIAGIIWLMIGAVLAIGLIGLIQRLLISGTALVSGLGSMSVGEKPVMGDQTAEPAYLLTEDDFNDPDPVVTMEPEELFSIPVEETIEDLAKENEQR